MRPDKVDRADKSSAGLSKGERSFIMDAAQGGMKEVEMGKLAQQKGKNADLKQFASQTVPTLEEHPKIAHDLAGSSKDAGKASSKGAK
jgi:putative membrane protein